MGEGAYILERSKLGRLFDVLKERGFQVIGPTIADQAIVYDELDSPDHLPIGWTDEQDGGSYRLKRRADNAVFGYVVGPKSWKQFLHPPRVKLFESSRSEDYTRALIRFKEAVEGLPGFDW